MFARFYKQKELLLLVLTHNLNLIFTFFYKSP